MFSRMPETDLGAVEFEHHPVVLGRQMSAISACVRMSDAARKHAGMPGPSLRAAPDHHGIGTGAAQNFARHRPRVSTSPLATSGTEITSRTARIASQSALPL